jgi:hypothetical protein
MPEKDRLTIWFELLVRLSSIFSLARLMLLVFSVALVTVSLGIISNFILKGDTGNILLSIVLAAIGAFVGGIFSLLISNRVIGTKPPVKVFVSYSRQDIDFVRRIIEALNRHDFRVSTDQALPVGADLATDIPNLISDAHFLVVVLSKSSVSSEWVNREIQYAQEKGKTILPIAIEKDVQLPFTLRTIQYVDLSEDFQSGLTKLFRSLDQNIAELSKEKSK